MYLVQMLLPVYDNEGQPFDAKLFAAVRRELVERWGGVTTFTRAPGSGAWTEPDGSVVRDDIFIYEVMVEHLDRPWWRTYREETRRRFRQDELVVRVTNFGRRIPAEALDKLFEPLAQAKAAGAPGDRRASGLGLGLFIARTIVLGHGGSLGVESSEQAGTVFAARFPRRS